MKIENLCIHCMQEKNNASEICPFCGFDPKTAEIPPYHLQPFSILAGKYLLGMAIGEGITYIGMDLNLEMRVAIKEYYPNGCATRNRSESNTVISYSSSMHDIFEEGREKFINEARLLAKCNNLPEIVSVKDFFKENHTAYIVMEYIDGITLKEFINKQGSITWNDALFFMTQILRAVQQPSSLHNSPQHHQLNEYPPYQQDEE